MRFFKAFNILHRRTKSATFVPGPSLDSFTSPNARNSSSSYSHLSPNVPPSSTIFDMATSEASSIPPRFNHLAARPPSFWHPRRQSGRTSVANSSSIDEEHFRLKEGIKFWILEHSKLHNVLNTCHAELMAARQKIVALESKAELDAKIIVDLSGRLAQYPRPKNNIQLGCVSAEQDALSIPLVPAVLPSIGTLSTVRPITKAPTIEEYSNALRLTLATRKELRDQKKVTRFWKRRASLTVGEDHDLITPSVSAISSIHEAIPAGRQAALETLIMRRGIPSRLTNVYLPGQNPSNNKAERPPSLTVMHPDVLPSLPSSNSKGSVGSRLAPLASESLKAEINSKFGSRNSSARLSSIPRRARDGSLAVSDSFNSFDTGHIIGSSNLSAQHEGNFEETDTAVDCATSFDGSLLKDLPSWPSSFLQISALPSGSSETFGEHILASAHLQNSVSNKVFMDHATSQQASVKQASKECTSRRSWQHYNLMKSNSTNRTATEMVNSLIKRRKIQSGKDKENNGLSVTLPAFERRRSRLPVPIFGKNDPKSLRLD